MKILSHLCICVCYECALFIHKGATATFIQMNIVVVYYKEQVSGQMPNVLY